MRLLIILNLVTAPLFADNLKMYMPVFNVDNDYKLRNDIYKLINWGQNNDMIRNVDKYQCKTFTICKCSLGFEHALGNNLFQRVKKLKGLGVIFNTETLFIPHSD